ncbi:MAG: aldo/keto reductase [Anaerolineales bacterium]|nr:aldo/keto reductase [Anaerolineales bacterium]
MPMRRLGKSGISVTEVGLGLWAIGGDSWGHTEDAISLATINTAMDAGVNFFDTADVYGSGHSEELLGEALRGRRNRFVVATKIGWQNFDGELGRTAYDSVEKLITGIESSLKRLQTDYLDVIQSHINFRDPTMDVFLEGFQRLQKDGKVRAYGVSTSDFEYLKTFNADGGCATLQIDYSILNRSPENEIFNYCQENNVGVIVRGPLAMGILTGKFTPKTKFDEFDWRRRWIDNPEEKEIFLQDLEKVEQLRSMTDGRSLTQLALQFVMAHPAVTTAIPGAKTTEQAEENISSAKLLPLTAEDLYELNSITPPGGGRRIWPA